MNFQNELSNQKNIEKLRRIVGGLYFNNLNTVMRAHKARGPFQKLTLEVTLRWDIYFCTMVYYRDRMEQK